MKFSSLMAIILPAIFLLSFAQTGSKNQTPVQLQSIQNGIFNPNVYPAVDQTEANSPALLAVYSASPGNNSGKQQISSGEPAASSLSSVRKQEIPDRVALSEGEFQFTIANDVQVSENLLEFDLNIVNTNPSQQFELASVKAGIRMNPSIINGGEIQCFIRSNSSGLLAVQRPTTVLFNSATNTIELYSRPLPGAGNGTIISTNPANPTRVCRIRLGNSLPWATGQANLAFCFQPSSHPTEVSEYAGGVNVDLVTSASNCFSLASDSVLNFPPPALAIPYNVTGNGTYCPSDFPVQVGLDNSQTGILYRLYRDGVQEDTHAGSDTPISWDCQLPGLYTVDGVNAGGVTQMTGNAMVSIKPEPTVFLMVEDNSVCNGSPVTLTALTENQGTEGTYDWYIFSANTSFMVTTPAPSYTYIPADGDHVRVDYIESLPCQYCAESNYILMSVKPSSVGGTVSGDKTIFLGNSTGTLALGGNSGNVLKWQKCLNEDSWADIENSGATYSEVPLAAGTWRYRAIVQNNDCEADTSGFASISVLSRTLSVKVFPQGIYNPVTQLLNKAKDTDGDRFANDTADLVTIRLVNNTVPYNDICSFKDIALPVNGIITVDIPDSLTSTYYLVINHRNSLETWSSVPVSLNGELVFYNFTTGADKAYGFNLEQMGNSWVVFGGDINQDGAIDLGDMSPVDNDVYNYLTGYLDTDVNGDGMIDTGDLSIIDNNSGNYVGSIFPHTQELPAITTNPAQNISSTTATLSGEVTLQGGSPVTKRGLCWGTSPNPVITELHTTCGSGTGSFTCEVTGLEAGTHYYFRAYATNYSGTAYGQLFSFTSISGGGAPCPGIAAITYGAQTYNTVQIGTQCWLKENLNIGDRADFSQIQSNNNVTEKHCYNNLESNCDIYGGLYSWDEMLQYTSYSSYQGICPSGWHVPSNAEWYTLTDYLGGGAGGLLKEKGNRHWSNPNEGATNESGFSALPGGYAVAPTSFSSIRNRGAWFTSNLCGGPSPGNRFMYNWNTLVEANTGCSKSQSNVEMSVRCVLDDSLKVFSAKTTAVTKITSHSARCEGEVMPTGGSQPIARGFCWSTIQNPTIAGLHSSDGNGIGSFICNITGLLADTIYYVRAYVTNCAGTAYGNELYFSTATYGLPCPGLDSVIYEGKTYKTVKIGNQCWFKENLNVGTRIGKSQQQTNNTLTEKHCYDDLETNCDSYGGLYQWNEMMQYTPVQRTKGICPSGWHIPTTAEWSILSGYLGGNNVAGGKLKEIGTATWRSPNTGATNESGFTALAALPNSYVTGLSGQQTFYWSSTVSYSGKAWNWSIYYNYPNLFTYEYNDVNTGLSVRCLWDDSLQLATVTTTGISAITQSTALGGGNISYQGGSAVTERGVCYSTFQNPGISDFRTTDGTGDGNYTSSLADLNANTTFYVRAYATNKGGTAYGNEVSFTTAQIIQLPAVTTSPVISISLYTAISGGIVTSMGSSPVTQRGMCWGTSENPTLEGTHSADGAGEGTFISSIAGLNANTTYYARAYATNNEGTGYGENKIFITYVGSCPDVSAVLYEDKFYNTVQIGTQCWLKQNLNVGSRISGSVNQANNNIKEKYCYENLESNCAIYGGLYQWNEMMQYTVTPGAKGICPDDWHIPTKVEWNLLFDYLGGTIIAGGKMKEQGFTHWLPPNISATNEVGFSALGCGERGNYSGDPFVGLNSYGIWWSSNQLNALNSYGYKLESNWGGVYGSDMTTVLGNPVRCIKNITPTVSTTVISNITSSAAVGGGTIGYGTGSPVISRGVCWSVSQNPTILDMHSSDGSGFGVFNSNLIGLDESTIYFVRAYTIRYEGIDYGDEVSFKTEKPNPVPIVNTSPILNISKYSATSGGEVTANGSSAVIERGVCWSTLLNPSISDSHSSDGSGLGSFISALNGLELNTTYYVRAYASNSDSTGYGNMLSFTTANFTLPVVSTQDITNITTTSAMSGGDVSAEDGLPVTSRGVCWSTSINPTINNSHTTDGDGTGSFESTLTGLLPDVFYYVRAYATNRIGTNYGNWKGFFTKRLTLPILTTQSITNITLTSATAGGNVIDDGGLPITSRGICWSTTINPQSIDSHSNDGEGSGSFSSSLSGLLNGTTYYVRAYATNNIGTSYGDEVSFTTLTGTFYIGQSFGGGIIFYIYNSGNHGLIAAPADLDIAQWGCSGTSITGTSTAVGSGPANTTVIVSGCYTSGIAARNCYDLVLGEYSDWYLPSKNELNQLYVHRSVVSGLSLSEIYWSSSQNNVTGFPWSQSFLNGSQSSDYGKDNLYHVRPVRSF